MTLPPLRSLRRPIRLPDMLPDIMLKLRAVCAAVGRLMLAAGALAAAAETGRPPPARQYERRTETARTEARLVDVKFSMQLRIGGGAL